MSGRKKSPRRDFYRGHLGQRPSAAFVQPAILIPFPLTSASAILRLASWISRHTVLRETPSFSAAASCSRPSRSISRIRLDLLRIQQDACCIFPGTAAWLVASRLALAFNDTLDPGSAPAGAHIFYGFFAVRHDIFLIIHTIVKELMFPEYREEISYTLPKNQEWCEKIVHYFRYSINLRFFRGPVLYWQRGPCPQRWRAF